MNLIEEEIKKCELCGNLSKLTQNTIKFGPSKILILGESPAKDGWSQSGRAFYNKEGKFHASGKILEKLLKLCDLNIEDINFTECCKCIISDRKNLRKCMQNCKSFLFKQIDLLNCDIVLPMGQYPTEAILGVKVKKLKDFVGKEFEINFGKTTKKVIPIYHTSPANPLCYKGNEEIFINLKKIIKK